MSLVDEIIGSDTYIARVSGITGAKYEVSMDSVTLTNLDDGDEIIFDNLESGRQYELIISRVYINVSKIAVTLSTEDPLSLAEVQAFTYDGENVALNGTATQSSTGWGAAATRANDGQTSGVWGHSSVTHTASAQSGTKWWNVVLATPSPVTQIVVYNRTNCCWDRLEGAILSAYDEDGNVVFQETLAGVVEAQTFTIV